MWQWRLALPEVSFHAVLGQVRQRWRIRAIALAVAVAGAAFAGAIVLTSMSIALGAFAIALLVTLVRGVSLSNAGAASLVERQAGGLDNLLVTAAELAEKPRPVRAEIVDELQRQVSERVGVVDPARVVPLLQPLTIAAAVVAGCALLATFGGTSIRGPLDATSAGSPPASATAGLTVRVTPPAYTKRQPQVFNDPVQVSVIAGSAIQVESGGTTVRAWVATKSEGIELREGAGSPQFLLVNVVPDAPPVLRVVTPGKDTALAEPKGNVAITLESRDDLGLSSLVLRYTKASGGGENLAFTEGEVPLHLDRRSDQHWNAHASLALEPLNLSDGDIVVYRAIARDSNPGGSPVQSEQYLIEIGKNAQIADAGFSLPTEERKYAISQQMVIYKTEQLLKNRPRLRQGDGAAGSEFLSESQGIAVEQRMVRAEVVFLGGGEVEDELEEAAKSDELTEGRLQNTGRVEMLRAINAMSRAEAQLNEGRAAEALVYERQALVSLERALDRRRYFLRTLPDRSRIDTDRRLTGERRDARSWSRDERLVSDSDAVTAARRVMRDLAVAAVDGAGVDAALAARLAAVDADSVDLQRAAVAIASASSAEARRLAARNAMQVLTAHVLKSVSAASVIDLGNAALDGLLTDELARRPRQ
jgi:hypothetical protein